MKGPKALQNKTENSIATEAKKARFGETKEEKRKRRRRAKKNLPFTGS